MEPNQDIKIGIGVMVMRDGKVLLGKRKNLVGKGLYAWPGGKLDYMESFENCARRECKEEADIEIDNVRFLRLMNFKDQETGKHFVDIGLVADWKSGEPKVMEPDKCEGWDWYDTNDLPDPLFLPAQVSLEAIKTNRNFFDA